MATLPHDLTDLALAPLVLQLDRQLASYSALSTEEIHRHVGLEAGGPPTHAQERRDHVLGALTSHVDTRGWALTWTTRGLRLHHDARSVTLGIPPSLTDYLELR